MKDLEIRLDDNPGSLASMGEALASAGISIEGGGVWVCNQKAVAHFLFKDAAGARRTLEAAGIEVIAEHEILVQRLHQERPGQLGKIARKMAEAGVNIRVMYSDHENQLILVVDDWEKGNQVSIQWMNEQYVQ
ncbi:MAG TPA: hypothetical protein VGD17_03665 [Chitinophagaceae bacterium]